MGLPAVKKNFEDMYKRLDRIPACNEQADRQTDRQTDTFPRHSPCYAYASRGKNRFLAVGLLSSRLSDFSEILLGETAFHRISAVG